MISPTDHDPRALLEAVPNFSVGRDVELLVDLRAAMRSAGAYVADIHADIDHDRSVFTVFGTAGILRTAILAAAAIAVARIDLRAHAGVHPRVGALDVLPFVALDGSLPAGQGGTTGSARQLAREVAAALADAHDLSVVGYAGLDVHDVAPFAGALRAGSLAGIALRMAAGEVVPFAGPAVPHPTAGVTLCSQRDVLVAFNVLLETSDLDVARSVAASLRESGGGLSGVRAIGVVVADRDHRVQVATNVERWREASPADVLERVRQLAASHDVTIASCELVGLAPGEAVDALEASGITLEASSQPRLELHAAAARAALSLD